MGSIVLVLALGVLIVVAARLIRLDTRYARDMAAITRRLEAIEDELTGCQKTVDNRHTFRPSVLRDLVSRRFPFWIS